MNTHNPPALATSRVWEFPVPGHPGVDVILSEHPEGFYLQEASHRGHGLEIGTFPNLPSAVAAVAVWLATGGNLSAMHDLTEPDPQARRLQTRFGLPAETAETVARLAFGGRENG